MPTSGGFAAFWWNADSAACVAWNLYEIRYKTAQFIAIDIFTTAY
ncbi:MAG: hypothetical protein WBP38_15285 [Hyphomicrobium sp.]|jgi:hypothetical protein